MNLGLCIANLLRRYPAVDVPGIGVFKKTHATARYDERQSAFVPPVDHVELVEGHTDVFPIATYVQIQLQVDEPTAMLIIEKAVGEAMESITRHGEALLEGLGYLLADGASFVFKPIEIEGFQWEPVVTPTPEVVAADEEAATSSGPDHTAPPRSNRSVWWGVAAALVLAAAAGAVWYVQPAWFDRATLTGLLGRIGEVGHGTDNGEQPDGATAPATGQVVDPWIDDTAQTAALADQPVPAGGFPADSVSRGVLQADTVAAKPSVTYEIIVGSFATMKQASRFVAEMKAKGYDLHAIDSRMPGNRKKISWGSFATEEEAYRELARVQKNFEPGAWIAKITHD